MFYQYKENFYDNIIIKIFFILQKQKDDTYVILGKKKIGIL